MNISRCLYCLGNCDLSVSHEEASYTSPSPEIDVRFTFTCEPSYAMYTPNERNGRAKYRKTIKLPRLHSNIRFTRDTMLCHSFIRDSIKEVLRDWPLIEDRLLGLIKVAMQRAAYTYWSRPSYDHKTVHVDFSVVVEHKHVVFDEDLEEGEERAAYTYGSRPIDDHNTVPVDFCVVVDHKHVVFDEDLEEGEDASEEVTNDEENNDDDHAEEEAEEEESDDDEDEEATDDEESDDDEEEETDDEESDDDDDDMVPAADYSIEKLHRVVMKDASEMCSICLDGFDVNPGCEGVFMPCSHVFHGDCIVKWLSTSHYCPVCRFEMPTS